MKKIAVFFKDLEAMGPPFDKPEYWETYQELDAEIKKSGGQFFIVRHNSTYLGNGEFSKSWQFKNGELVETGSVKIDYIYDKGKFKHDDKVKVLNNRYVNEVCTDKYKTYQLFKDFCPHTFLVNSEREFDEALVNLEGDKKVIKPVDEGAGKGVFIGNNQYLKECEYSFPLLVQEFLDTSDGIPGIYKGIHDLRVVFLNGEIIYSYYRTPPEGELLANVAQGGSLAFIPNKEIPKSVLEITELIKQNFKNDYCFSVDVGFVKGIPKIIELNSMVGLLSPKRGAGLGKFIKKLTQVLMS